MDDTEDARKYKAKNNREIDNLFRANGIIGSQVAGTDAYRRGHVWNFEWCSEDPLVGLPAAVAAVRHYMDSGLSFDDAFDKVSSAQPSCNHGSVVSDLFEGFARCRFCGR